MKMAGVQPKNARPADCNKRGKCTTAIRGDNPEGWWFIDPFFDHPCLPSEWLRLGTQEKEQGGPRQSLSQRS
jgi:hypothetical protein